MKFKVGDRVKIISCGTRGTKCDCVGKVGKIVNITGYEYNPYILDVSHVDRSLINEWRDGELELVSNTQFPEPPFYVDCPTEEIWNKVEKKMFEMGYKWRGGEEHVEKNGARINVGRWRDKKMTYASSYSLHEDVGGTFIPYQEFLGEEVREDKVPETATEKKVSWEKFHGGIDWAFDDGKPVKSFTQKIMDTLRSIPDRLKRALNANMRAFYKLGWIYGDLSITGEGKEALTNFLFDKFEKELGEVAAKKVKEAKKKKKDEDDE